MIFHRKCFTIARSIVTTGYGGPRRFVSSLSIVLKPGTLYSTDERTRNQCIHRALEEWKRLGFKNEGACCVEITSAYHHHKGNEKSREWMTVAYRDREGRLMRYEKADGSVWDRVHVYRDAELNKSDGERPERIWVETKKGGKK